ncbi:MAG: hypothetical protein AAGD32_18165 [Planctomycetota bacterium]
MAILYNYVDSGANVTAVGLSDPRTSETGGQYVAMVLTRTGGLSVTADDATNWTSEGQGTVGAETYAVFRATDADAVTSTSFTLSGSSRMMGFLVWSDGWDDLSVADALVLTTENTAGTAHAPADLTVPGSDNYDAFLMGGRGGNNTTAGDFTSIDSGGWTVFDFIAGNSWDGIAAYREDNSTRPSDTGTFTTADTTAWSWLHVAAQRASAGGPTEVTSSGTISYGYTVTGTPQTGASSGGTVSYGYTVSGAGQAGATSAGTIVYGYSVAGSGQVSSESTSSGSITYGYAVTGTPSVGAVGSGTIAYGYAVTGSASVGDVGSGSVVYGYGVTGSASVDVLGAGTIVYGYTVTGFATTNGGVISNGAVVYDYQVTGTAQTGTTGLGAVTYGYTVTGTPSAGAISAGTIVYGYSVVGTAVTNGGVLASGSVVYGYAITGTPTATVTSLGTVVYGYTVTGTAIIPNPGGLIFPADVLIAHTPETLTAIAAS